MKPPDYPPPRLCNPASFVPLTQPAMIEARNRFQEWVDPLVRVAVHEAKLSLDAVYRPRFGLGLTPTSRDMPRKSFRVVGHELWIRGFRGEATHRFNIKYLQTVILPEYLDTTGSLPQDPEINWGSNWRLDLALLLDPAQLEGAESGVRV